MFTENVVEQHIYSFESTSEQRANFSHFKLNKKNGVIQNVLILVI